MCGVDEVGRGSLAGPVVAAAVLLDCNDLPSGLADSKRLTPYQREVISSQIRSKAVSFNIAFVQRERIDEINILQATFEAMTAALGNIQPVPDHVFVDGNRFPDYSIPVTTIVRGDNLCISIAAASIIAKVARDHYMEAIVHERFPEYHFKNNKGYGTRAHIEAIARLGPCSAHRRTFLRKIIGGN